MTVDFSYLYQGLCGLARAHRANTMAGHLGAALIAGYCFGEDVPGLPEGVINGIEAELERIKRGEEAIWFNAKKAGITVRELFAAFPQEKGDKKNIGRLTAALAKNIGQLRQSGHNVIFTALAVRVLHDHPEYATPSLIAGIEKLIAGFNNAVPGRGYYGKKRGWITGHRVSLPKEDDLPLFRDEQRLAEVVVEEVISSASKARRGFGGLWHLINHAAGLIELSRYGYRSLARQGFAAYRQHLRLWRSLPDLQDELGPVRKATEDPRTPKYWGGMLKRDQARLTHRIKTLYGFFTLLREVDNADKRKRAENQFLYLMA